MMMMMMIEESHLWISTGHNPPASQRVQVRASRVKCSSQQVPRPPRPRSTGSSTPPTAGQIPQLLLGQRGVQTNRKGRKECLPEMSRSSSLPNCLDMFGLIAEGEVSNRQPCFLSMEEFQKPPKAVRNLPRPQHGIRWTSMDFPHLTHSHLALPPRGLTGLQPWPLQGSCPRASSMLRICRRMPVSAHSAGRTSLSSQQQAA